MHFIERDNIDTRTRKPPYQPFQKVWCDFEQPIGLKALRPARPHVVQGQNRADATQERAQPMVHPAEVERFQTCPDDRFLQIRQAPARPR
jgi:hypothetical protein